MRRLAICLILTACTQPERPAEPTPQRAVVPAPSVQVEAQIPVAEQKPAAGIPRDALRYQRDVIRLTRSVWGLDAPVAVFGGQIHQESSWKPAAKSEFASGLAQFTPATAAWISGAYPKELGNADPGNPSWAIQALAIYDKRLFDGFTGNTECDRMAFALSGYNGGPGWVSKDKAIAKTSGLNPQIYFGSVELTKDARRPEYLAENRSYPRRILKVLSPLYVTWGRTVKC